MDNYSVYEVANLLGTSHTTIYNKINNKEIYKELRNFIKKQGKSTIINSDGIDILKKYIPVKESLNKVDENFITESNEPIKKTFDNTGTKDSLEIYKELIDNLQSQISDLRNDKEKLFTEVEQQRLLHQNTQILLKQSQEKIYLLESKEQKKKRLFNWFTKN
jgi:hypothetical protein